MEWKYLAPLIGVALGWLLNELSTHFRTKGAEKRDLGKTIVTLLYLRHEIVRLGALLDMFKDTYSTERYEKFRQLSYERYTLPENIASASLDSAIESVATVSPVLATRLKRAKEAYIFSRKVKLDHSSKNKDVYLQLLSSNEAITDLNLRDIEKVILRLSFRHGFLTWLQVRKIITDINEEREDMQKAAITILGALKNNHSNRNNGEQPN